MFILETLILIFFWPFMAGVDDTGLHILFQFIYAAGYFALIVFIIGLIVGVPLEGGC